MVGRTLGHYRIVEAIGKGGMGEVYRARDLHLDRDVAVKILPAGTLADEPARRRFHKEAEALSKLNHPNIQTVFDFDTQDGLDFLVTEYVPGVTLADKLAGKALPEKEVLRLGQQLAEGLAAAHEQGIVHRDLKPSNLRVTPDGRLKILDFGVAKLLRPSGETVTADSLTAETVAGTPLYMAPEQRRGEPADARSDLYSAGLVLWEMATGKPPVAGRLSGTVSPELQRIVEKCLEEEPENRYQSAKELAVDLRRLASLAAAPGPASSPQAPAWGRRVSRWQVPPGSAWRLTVGLGAMVAVLAALVGLNVGGLRERLFGTGTSKIDSLAVLPLKNLMGDPEQDYFVEGMHEALTAELSKITALKVISRTSAMRYKDTDKPMPQIARELGVTGLVEGSVLREADQVRITVQLIHGPSDWHLWAQSFDRELRNILALHSEVARAIANEIKVKLTPQEQGRLASTRTVVPQAYEAYLKGRYHWNKRTREGLERAVEYFNQAISEDPTYALAYSGLADSYSVLSTYVMMPAEEGARKAQAAAKKALAIDDTLAEAHTSLAYPLLRLWDWADAESEFKRALELNPNYEHAHHWYGLYLGVTGRFDEALAEMKRAQKLDPLSLIINANVCWVHFYARRYDEAIEQCRKTLELDPNFPNTLWYLGMAYGQKGMYKEAIAEHEKLVALSAGRPEPFYLVFLGHSYAIAGRKREALKVLQDLGELSKSRPVSSYHIAVIYVGLGQQEEAFVWLEKAYRERDMVLIKVDPRIDPLRDEPRFQDLLRRMNFPP